MAREVKFGDVFLFRGIAPWMYIATKVDTLYEHSAHEVILVGPGDGAYDTLGDTGSIQDPDRDDYHWQDDEA